MAKKQKLLFIKILESSFVVQDEAVLREHFEVKSFTFGWVKSWRHLLRQVQLIFWLLRHIWTAKYVFSWFCDYHSFFPMMFSSFLGKRGIIVFGGFDAEKNIELNYGGHVKALRSGIIKQCCKWGDLLLPVSKFTAKRLQENTGLELRTKSEVLYNGLDQNLFPNIELKQERSGLVCVTGAKDVRTSKVKGLDLFVEAAKRFPEKTFTLIGIKDAAKDYLESFASNNVEIHSWMPREDLVAYYLSSEIVCQLSRIEAFGLALAEGMYAGCIPIGMKHTGMAEIIETPPGYLLDTPSVELAVDAIGKALKASQKDREAAHERIRVHFDLEDRGKRLIELIKG